MRRYIDLWIVAFSIALIVASIISVHGTYVFFSYVTDNWIAYLATALTAFSVPLLDAAGTLAAKTWQRVVYIAGGGVFLVMETLAQYYAGQAYFTTRVLAALKNLPDSDLLAIASTNPQAGRWLVGLYLAMPSVIVAFFAFALAYRIRQLNTPAVVQFDQGLSDAQSEIALLRRQLEEAQNQPSYVPRRAVVLAYVRHQQKERSLLDIAKELGWSESTLRGWLNTEGSGQSDDAVAPLLHLVPPQA